MTLQNDQYYRMKLVGNIVTAPAGAKTLENWNKFRERIRNGHPDTGEGRGRVVRALLDSPKYLSRISDHKFSLGVGNEYNYVLISVDIDPDEADAIRTFINARHDALALGGTGIVEKIILVMREEYRDAVDSYGLGLPRNTFKLRIVNGFNRLGGVLPTSGSQVSGTDFHRNQADADAQGYLAANAAIWYAEGE